jgi:hypothetical protein
MNWYELNACLPGLDESAVKELLDHERTNGRRKSFLERLHQRFTAMRAERERAEILTEAIPRREG